MQVTAAVNVTLDNHATKQVTLNRLAQLLGFSDYQRLVDAGACIDGDNIVVDDWDYHSTWKVIERPATELDKAVLVVIKEIKNV